MGAPESKVERYLHQRVTALGGTTRKWTSPGRAGVPDRICFLQGRVFFVEIKTDTGKLSVRQQREIDELKRHGAEVFVVYGVSQVSSLIEALLPDTDVSQLCEFSNKDQ